MYLKVDPLLILLYLISDPPLSEQDIPIGLWLCHHCRSTQSTNQKIPIKKSGSVSSDSNNMELKRRNSEQISRPATPNGSELNAVKLRLNQKRSVSRSSSLSRASSISDNGSNQDKEKPKESKEPIDPATPVVETSNEEKEKPIAGSVEMIESEQNTNVENKENEKEEKKEEEKKEEEKRKEEKKVEDNEEKEKEEVKMDIDNVEENNKNEEKLGSKEEPTIEQELKEPKITENVIVNNVIENENKSTGGSENIADDNKEIGNEEQSSEPFTTSAFDELIRAAAIMNPRQFELPREYNFYTKFPGDDRGILKTNYF